MGLVKNARTTESESSSSVDSAKRHIKELKPNLQISGSSGTNGNRKS